MTTTRRGFMKALGATVAAFGTLPLSGVVSATESAARVKGVKAFAFDAYGTLFDVFSVTALCEQLFPGKGNGLAQLWRAKQLQYSLLRSLMGRHKDFWQLTEDGLVFASKSMKLDLTPEKRKRLMDAYLSLSAFPDVKPGLEALKKQGCDSPSCRTVSRGCWRRRRKALASLTCSRPSSVSKKSKSSR
jgi:2-haloacid dehalogenase